MTTHPLHNWIPYRLLIENDTVRCRWLYTGERRFDAPFFNETIGQCMRHPYNSAWFRSESSLNGLIELAQDIPPVSPTAFIFHVSRCGSTLLSQLLAISEHRIVLSEVPLLDELLRLSEHFPDLDATLREQALLAAIRLLGQQRTGEETELFIKLDSWHITFYETLRRLFPDVPVVLLYRPPDPVIQSHRRQRGMHAVPGLLPPYLFNLPTSNQFYLNADAYTASVLTHYYGRFLTVARQDNHALLLAYQPDGSVLLRSMLTFLALNQPESDWAKVSERSGFHAKHPGQAFAEALPDNPIPSYQLPAQKAYNDLETQRLNQLMPWPHLPKS